MFPGLTASFNTTLHPLLTKQGKLERANPLLRPVLEMRVHVLIRDGRHLYLGCDALCDTTIDFYWKTNPLLTLGIVANWVIPIIALLAALPYDSLHEHRIGRTLSTLASWLGSPQTALTATIFNIYQLARCKSATKVSVAGRQRPPEPGAGGILRALLHRPVPARSR